MADEAFSSNAEADRFFRRFAAWAADSERTLALAHAELLKQVYLGVARCTDLEQYNAAAVGYFAVSNMMLRKIREAGISGVPDVAAYPQVFAHDLDIAYGATSDILPSVRVDLRCQPNGFAQANLKVSPRPRNCGPSTEVGQPDGLPGRGISGLGAAPLVIVAYSVGTALVLAVATFGALKVGRVFTGRDRLEFEQFMRKTFGQDVLRLAEARNRCIEDGVARIPPGLRPSEHALKVQEVALACERQIPAPPPLKFGSGVAGTVLFGLLLGTVIIGGTVYAVRRSRRV